MTRGAWVLDGMVVCNAALPLRVSAITVTTVCVSSTVYMITTLSAAASEILNQRP